MAEPPKQRGRPKAKPKVNTSSMLRGTSRSNPPRPPPELAIWGGEDIVIDAARSPRKAALAASAAIVARPTSGKLTTPTPARGKTISSSTSSSGLKKGTVKSEEVEGTKKNSRNSSDGGGNGGSRRQSSRSEILDPAVSGVKSKKGTKIVVAGTSARQAGGSSHCSSRNTPDDEDKSKRRKRENGGGSRADTEGSVEDEELSMSSSKKRKGPANAVASSKATVSPADDKSTKHPSSTDKRSKGGGRQDQKSSAPPAKRRGLPSKNEKSSVGSIKETPHLKKRGRPPGSKSCRKDMSQEQTGGRKSSSGKPNLQEGSACEGRDEKNKAKNAAKGKVASSSKANSTSLHAEKPRSAPNVFKANSSAKQQSQPPGPSPAPRGRPKAKATASSGKKGAIKSPALKKSAKPLPPPPPPPPPPPYRFEYPGWPAVGGRDLLSVGVFLTAALPILRFRRGFEVKMRQLEEAVTCARPQESSFLAMLHARLLSNRKELKAMRVGEDKFPYSWWTNRLKNRLAKWYLRRAVLRELIEDAEGSDGDKEGDEEVIANEEEQCFKVKKVKDVGDKRKEGESLRNDVRKAAQCEAPHYEQAHEIVVAGDRVPGNMTRVHTTNGGASPPEHIPTKIQLNGMKDNTSAQAGSENVPAKARTDAIPDDEAEVGGITKPEVSGRLANGSEGGIEDTGENHGSSISDYVTRVKKEVQSADHMAREEQKGPGEKLRCPGELLLAGTDTNGDRRTAMDADTEATADADIAAGENGNPENAEHREGEMSTSVNPDEAENGETVGAPTVARTEAFPTGGESVILELDDVGKRTGECLRTSRRAKRPTAQMAAQMAEEETQKPKKREREVDAANERQRRRMAQKLAELEADDEDSSDRRKRKSGRKLGPRERLLQEFETMELTDLRLQLRDVETLLRNLEGASGEGAAATATANGSTKTPLTPAASALSNGDKASETSHDPGPTGEIDTSTGAARAGSNSKDAGRECAATKGGPDGCGTSARYSEGNGESSIRSGTSRHGSGSDSVSRSSNSASVAKDTGAALTEDDAKRSRVSTPPIAEADLASPHLEVSLGDVANPTVSSNSTRVSGCEATEDGVENGIPNHNGIRRSEGTGAHAISTALTSMVSGGTGVLKEPNTCLDGVTVRGECPGADKDGDLAGDSGVFLMLKEEDIEDDKENPLVKGSYETLTVSQRVAILSALCEFSIGFEHVRERIIDEVEPDILRVTPFGYDSSGRLYYRFSQFRAEMRVYRTVEKESPVPEVDEAAMQIVGRTSSQLPSPSLTSSKRRPQRLRGGDEVELVADSLEGMEKLLDALGKSKSKTKKDDFKLLVSLAEEIEAMRAYVAEQLEKEEKRKASELARERRALLALAPRRRSGRLISNQRGESRCGETRAHGLEALPNPPSSPSRSSRGPMDGVEIAPSTLTNPDCGEGENVFGTARAALVGDHTAARVSNGGQATCVDAREVQGGRERARQEEQDGAVNKDESGSTGKSEAFSSLGKRPRDDEVGTTSDIPPLTMSELSSLKMETDAVHERDTGSGSDLAGPDRMVAHVRGNAVDDVSVTTEGTTDALAACEAPANKRQRFVGEHSERRAKQFCHGKRGGVDAPSTRPTEDTRGDEDKRSFDALDDQSAASVQPPEGTLLLPLPKSRDQLECAINSDRNRATPRVVIDGKGSLAEDRLCPSESTHDEAENELPRCGGGEGSGTREGTESGEASARASLNDDALRIMAQAAYSRPKATNRTSDESESRDAGGSCTEPCDSWNAAFKPEINTSIHASNDSEMTAGLAGAIGGVDGGRGSGNEDKTLQSSELAQVHEG